MMKTSAIIASGMLLALFVVSPLVASEASAQSTTIGTNTFVVSGGAAESVVLGQALVSQTYTNSYSSSLSVYMWVSVMNSAGETVAIYLGSATVGAGQQATIAAALFSLPSGNYTAQVFLTTGPDIVVSTTSTTSPFTD